LRGFVGPAEAELIAVLRGIAAQAPFRQMVTPAGHRMSANPIINPVHSQMTASLQ